MPPGALIDDRLQLHHAAQLLAAFGQSYVEAREDDSHRSMTWDPAGMAFLSEEAPGGRRLRLHVASVVVSLGRSELGLRGVTLGQARDWLQAEMDRALGWPEYELPGHAVAEDSALNPSAAGLEELAGWYAGGYAILRELAHRESGASALRCWPHHFDLATLITVVQAQGREEARTVGVGLSPGDASLSAPYFYVNLWPAPETRDLPELGGPGRWNTQGWVGAVLPASEIVAAGGGENQAEVVRRFIDLRVDAARKLLETR